MAVNIDWDARRKEIQARAYSENFSGWSGKSAYSKEGVENSSSVLNDKARRLRDNQNTQKTTNNQKTSYTRYLPRTGEELTAGLYSHILANAATNDRYRQKYDSKNYNEIQSILSNLPDGDEKNWLSKYIESAFFDRASSSEIIDIQNKYYSDIENLQKQLDDLRVQNGAYSRGGYAGANINLGEQISALEQDSALEQEIKNAKDRAETLNPYIVLAQRRENVAEWDKYRADGNFLRTAHDGATIKNPTIAELDQYAYDIDNATNGRYDEATAQQIINNPVEVKNKLAFFLEHKDDGIDYLNSRPGTYEDIIHKGFMYNWDKLKPEEINMYNYLLATQGEEASEKYLDDIQVLVDKRVYDDQTERTAKAYSEANGLEKVALNIATVPTNVIGGAAAFADDVSNIIKYRSINPYSPGHSFQQFSSEIRGLTAQDIEKSIDNDTIAKFVSNGYQAVMSGLDSALGSHTLKTKYTITIGMGATSQRAKELYEAGASNGQIMLGSIASGIIEGLFEKVSLDKFAENFLESDIVGLKDFLLKALVQGGIEASEEVNTEISNMIIDAIVMGANSDNEKLIREFMSAGDSEIVARQKAALNAAIEVFWAGYGGFISGGTMAAVRGTPNYLINNSIRNEQNMGLYGDSIQDLINESLELDPNNKLAQKLKEKLDAGKEVKAGEVTRIVNQNNKAITELDISSIQEATANRLTELGETGDVAAIASALTKQVTGQKLSNTEQQAINNSRYGKRVANELNPENINSGDYSSAWAEKIDTSKINVDEYSRLVQDAEIAQENNAQEATQDTAQKNDASNETESTVINDDPTEHTVAEQRVIEEYKNDVDSNVKTNLERANSLQNKGKSVDMLSEEAQQDLVARYDGKTPSDDYIKAYRALYSAGKVFGDTTSFDVAAKANSSYVSRLGYDTAVSAFNAGLVAASQETQKARKQQQRILQRGTGTVTNNSTAELTETKKMYQELLGYVAKKTGLSIDLVDKIKVGDTEANGSFTAALMTMVLSENSDNAIATLGHELAEFGEAFASNELGEIRETLLDWYASTVRAETIDNLIESYRTTYEKAESGKTYDEAKAEVLNDAIGDLLSTDTGIERLVQWARTDSGMTQAEQKTFFERIRDWFNGMITALKNLIKDSNVTDSQRELLQMELEQQNALLDKFFDVVDIATERANELAPAEGGAVDMNDSEAFADSSVATHYQIRPPYSSNTQAYRAFVDGLNEEARSTFDMFEYVYKTARLRNASNAKGDKTVSAINISAPYLTVKEWNARIESDVKWREAAQRIAEHLPDKVTKNMGLNKDGTLNPMPIEEKYKMNTSLSQRLIDALPLETIDKTYQVGDKTITLPTVSARQSVGGEAYRRAILNEVRELYNRGKLKQVKLSTLSNRDAWGALSLFAENGKTGASVDFTTLYPQMMFNEGCFYCYRRAAMESGVNNKLVARSVWYTGEILRMSDADIKKLNTSGGLRIQSFGDWMPYFSAQLADLLYDAEMRGLQVKIITKEASMVDYIATLREQGIGNNLYFNLSADYVIEKAGSEIQNRGNTDLNKINPDRPFVRNESGMWWKRAMSVEEAAKIREMYPWVNVRIVATTREEFIRGLLDPNVDVVTGYHGNIRSFERIDSTTGEKVVNVEPLGDSGMPVFEPIGVSPDAPLYQLAKAEWQTKFSGKTKYHQALAAEIEKRGLQLEYYIKTCCITGRCATCNGKCGKVSRNFDVKNATNRDAASRVYWTEHMNSAVDNEVLGVRYSIKTDKRISELPGDKYSYDSLISKPDMSVTILNKNTPANRADVVYEAKRNAAAIGRTNKDGSVTVHVDDIDTDVVLSTKGLKHGLDRRFEENAPITLKAGEIINNSIRINELIPSKREADKSYVLIGAAISADGNLYVVRSVVNSFSNELTSMDVLYAINAKKESTAVLNAPQVSTPSYRTTISISELLDYVNRYFPDILPESVLRHYGQTSRPEGKLGESALYSLKTDKRLSQLATNRELLAKAAEDVDVSNFSIEEKNALNIYKSNLEKLEKIEARKADIESKSELSIDDRNRIKVLEGQMKRLNNKLNSFEKTKFLTSVTEKALKLLTEEYGAIKPGEKAARVVEVPRKTNDGNKVSQTVRTAIEASATSDEMAETLKAEIVKGTFTYIPITDTKAKAYADKTLSKGWDNALIEWGRVMNEGRFGKTDVALGFALYNQAVNAGDGKTALRILTDITKRVRSSAQAVQAVRILKQLSPNSSLYALQMSIEGLQETLDEKYGENAPKLEMDSVLVQNYLNAKTDAEKEKAKKALYRDIASQLPNTWLDKWNSWRYLAMLGNARTHIRNIVGNAGFAPVRAVKNMVATGIEAATDKVSGGKIKRTKSIINLASESDRALYKAAFNDYNEVDDLISGAGKYSSAISEIESMKPAFGNSNALWRGMSKVADVNSGLLNLEDVWFSKPAYASALAGYLKVNGITAEQFSSMDADAKDTARSYAIKEAQKATYRDFNAFSDFVAGIGARSRNSNNKVSQTAGILTEGVLPFRRTPANILVRGIEYSPIGLLNGVKQAVFDVRSGNITAAEAIDTIASGLTGTALVALGALLFASGIIVPGEDDDDKQSKFDDLRGFQNYALNIGSKNITIDWLAPEALPFFVGAEIMKISQEDGQDVSYSTIIESLKRISEPMLEMSMLQSLNDVIDNVSYSDSKLISILTSAATSYVTQALPTIAGQIERVGEPERETTFIDRNNESITRDIQYLIAKSANKIPGVEYQQIPYIDAWGRHEDAGTVAERIVNNLFNPAYVSKDTSTEFDDELQRLYDAGYENVFPERVKQSQKIDGNYLTADQYVSYAEIKGSTQHDIVKDIISSGWYADMPDYEKADIIERAYEYANEVGKKAAVKTYELEGWIKDAANAEENGESVAEFIYNHQGRIDSITKHDFVSEHPECADISAKAISDYTEYCKKAGVSAEAFYDVWKFKNNNKKNETLNYIDRLDINSRQKDSLYYALGYAESTINDAPWHN